MSVHLNYQKVKNFFNAFPTAHISESCIKIKTQIFTFALLCGVSEGFMKVFKAIIKPFEAPQRSVKS